MITVIVPVFNAEKYISKCIKSILRQTYKDIELVLINDCSTDRTLSICQKYASCDERVVLVNKAKNEGVDCARCDGVQKAKGEWITFVDADDTLTVGALFAMWKVADKYGTDMVSGNICVYAFGGLLKRKDLLSKEYTGHLYNHNELMERFYISFFGVNILPVSMYGKLYKTELVRKAFHPSKLKFGEDLLFNMRLFPLLNTAIFIPNIVYNYRQGSGGTSRFMPYWIETVKRLYREKQNEMMAHNFSEQADHYIKVELINCLITYVEQFITFKRSTRQANIEALQQELQDKIYIELHGIQYKDKEVIEAIEAKDALHLYTRIEYKLSHAPFKAKAKRFIRLILKFVS